MKAAPKPASDRLQRPTQLPYDELMQFNQHCLAALELIKVFAERKMIRGTESRYWCAMLQELRACASQTVIEYIDQQELSVAAAASRERLKLEKRLLK